MVGDCDLAGICKCPVVKGKKDERWKISRQGEMVSLKNTGRKETGNHLRIFPRKTGEGRAFGAVLDEPKKMMMDWLIDGESGRGAQKNNERTQNRQEWCL